MPRRPQFMCHPSQLLLLLHCQTRTNLPRVLYWLEYTERDSSVEGAQAASREGSSGGKRAVPLSGSSIHSSMYASQKSQAMWLYLMILCWSHLLGMLLQHTWHVYTLLESRWQNRRKFFGIGPARTTYELDMRPGLFRKTLQLIVGPFQNQLPLARPTAAGSR